MWRRMLSRPTFLLLLLTNHHGEVLASVQHEHLDHRPGVVVPPSDGAASSMRADLPLLERVGAAGVQPAQLLVLADLQPDLDEVDAVVDEELLERHDLAEEASDLLGGGELHHPLDAGPVVPGPVEERRSRRAVGSWST